jgi:hypothetical protein
MKSKKDLVFDEETIQGLISTEPSFSTLMNPVNIQAFFDGYQEKSYDALIKRFGLNTT